MVHRVAVIGSGPSGLTSVKACLDEGMLPTCFESSDDIGGLWRFKASLKSCVYGPPPRQASQVKPFEENKWFFFSLQEVSEPNRANIYRSLTINISKEMMCYSDFPIPADYPNYMHHTRILAYFRMYAEHFKLLRHIRFQVTTYLEINKCMQRGICGSSNIFCLFQTSVKSIKQRPNFAHSGEWEVVTESKDGQQEGHVFDAVICCTGHFTYPHLPLKDFPGKDVKKYMETTASLKDHVVCNQQARYHAFMLDR